MKFFWLTKYGLILRNPNFASIFPNKAPNIMSKTKTYLGRIGKIIFEIFKNILHVSSM